MTKLLPHALRAGISYTEYWDMTLAEVTAIMSVYQDEQKELLKRQLSLCYNQAVMINNAVAGKLKPLYDMFPELYEEERNKAVVEQLKANMFKRMAAQNKKISAKGGIGE